MSEFVLINNIKKYRKERGWTQKELAKRCLTTKNTISGLENRNYNPSAYLAAILCVVFDVSFEDLFYLSTRKD